MEHFTRVSSPLFFLQLNRDGNPVSSVYSFRLWPRLHDSRFSLVSIKNQKNARNYVCTRNRSSIYSSLCHVVILIEHVHGSLFYSCNLVWNNRFGNAKEEKWFYIGLATKWLRVFTLGGNDKIRNHIVANLLYLHLDFSFFIINTPENKYAELENNQIFWYLWVRCFCQLGVPISPSDKICNHIVTNLLYLLLYFSFFIINTPENKYGELENNQIFWHLWVGCFLSVRCANTT